MTSWWRRYRHPPWGLLWKTTMVNHRTKWARTIRAMLRFSCLKLGNQPTFQRLYPPPPEQLSKAPASCNLVAMRWKQQPNITKLFFDNFLSWLGHVDCWCPCSHHSIHSAPLARGHLPSGNHSWQLEIPCRWLYLIAVLEGKNYVPLKIHT